MREKKIPKDEKSYFVHSLQHTPLFLSFHWIFCFRVHKRWNTLVIFRYKIKEKK